MSIIFNPFTSNFDYTGTSSTTYLPTVATETDLPSGDPDGAVRVVLATDRIYIYDLGADTWTDTGMTVASFSATGSTTGVTYTTVNDSGIIRPEITLHAADATHPGAVTTGSQTIAGSKTFSSLINADGGIDRSTSGTLTIGATNSTTINIGNSGATVNIQGTTIYENTPQLLTADPLITVNHGGGAGSGQNAGIEIEENNVITGYAETSADRNSWILKAPNTAGIATITPGAGGITLNQSSHDPLTLAAVGAVPSANGASLSSQVLTLQPASGSLPGLITAGTQTLGGAKTFSGNVAIDGTTRLATSLTGPLKASSGTVSASAVDLTSEVTGILPIANGGTNSNTTLNNNRVMQSSGSKIVEAAAITAARALISDSNGIPTQSVTTSAELAFVNGVTSAIQTQLDAKVIKSTGDISETSFTAADNQIAAANVTNLAFANATVRSFRAWVSIARSTTFEECELYGIQKSASWEMSQEGTGDDTGVLFSITSAGQVQYTSSSTGNTATIKFRAFVTGV